MKPEKLFLIMGIVFGLLYFLTIPPMQNPDETPHLMRAFQVSEGGFLYQKEGYSLPKNLVSEGYSLQGNLPFNPQIKTSFAEILKHTLVQLKPEDRQVYGFSNSGAYPPFAYFPHSAGILLGRFFNFSPVGIVYTAHLTGLLFFLIMGFITLRVIPVLKMPIALALLLPTNIAQSIAISADGVTHATFALTLAFLLKLILEKPESSIALKGKRDFILLAGLLSLLALCKHVYSSITLFLLLIPTKRFSTKWGRWGFTLGVPLLVILTILYWRYLIAPIFVTLSDSSKNFTFIKENPFQFLKILVSTIVTHQNSLLSELIAVFGHLDTRIYNIIKPKLFIIVILFLIFLDQEAQKKISAKMGLTSLLALFTSLVLIYTVFFITWSNPDSGFINGVQGRYLIPLFMMLLIAFTPAMKWIHSRWHSFPQWMQSKNLHSWIATISLLFIHLESLKAILRRFYGYF